MKWYRWKLWRLAYARPAGTPAPRFINDVHGSWKPLRFGLWWNLDWIPGLAGRGPWPSLWSFVYWALFPGWLRTFVMKRRWLTRGKPPYRKPPIGRRPIWQDEVQS